ncbi:MAG: hypothetical protein JWP65_998 [Ramlibacter sp.]|uniref:phasin family protein n=1 Tax=Ramlibacter sp. TaxID=1917967 RepID=UPI0026044B0B|nr:phasin family protein [Ramlibacter sp.]MDB5750577.1 hypothetical protein [Ramlibacter sp.]
MKKPSSDDSTDARDAAARLADTVRESAQQIWLAGLGAFSKAQQEGGKVFQSLVRDGVDLQRKTQAAAEERLSEATSRMGTIASELSSRASGQLDKLEGLFEDRVARAMGRLGMPAADELRQLAARVEALQRAVDQLQAGDAPARKVARKRAPARKTADRS